MVIATYGGANRIGNALASLDQQTAARALFEVLVVANGPDDGTSELIRERAKSAPIDIRLVQTSIGGFAQARNLGIRAARGEFITWVDDDDCVSTNYVATMLAHAKPDTVVVPIFADVTQGDSSAPSFVNYINRYLLRFCGQTVPFTELPTAANFDAGKVISTRVAASVSYDSELASGLDVLYWATVIKNHRLSITVPELCEHAVYYRSVRAGSVSRTTDERFGRDRISCIGKLQELRSQPGPGSDFVRALQSGQASNLGSWLKSAPRRRTMTLQSVRDLDVPDFPYGVMNQQCSDQLVISYAFPPLVDPAGLVAAKRLLEQGEPYDLVTHSGAGFQSSDVTSVSLIHEQLGRVTKVQGTPSRDNMALLRPFCEQTLRRAAVTSGGDPYARIYTRGSWLATHLAAAIYKASHPEVVWTAEFADPLSVDLAGATRFAELQADDLTTRVDEAVARSGFGLATDNLYQWLETATFALADRIIFTNELQREFLLQQAAHRDLASAVASRSQILHQPTLPATYYSLQPSNYHLAPGRIHLGYFGSFCETRDVSDILFGLESLTKSQRTAILLHLFTNETERAQAAVSMRGLSDCVAINEFVPFLEFLNLTTRLDWLVVSDVRASRTHGLNPYLPAKYFDYRGSGSKIWSVVEPGSTLDSMPSEAKTALGDRDGLVSFLQALA